MYRVRCRIKKYTGHAVFTMFRSFGVVYRSIVYRIESFHMQQCWISYRFFRHVMSDVASKNINTRYIFDMSCLRCFDLWCGYRSIGYCIERFHKQQCWISYWKIPYTVLDIVSNVSTYRVRISYRFVRCVVLGRFRIKSFLIQGWIAFRFFPNAAVLDIVSFFSIYRVGYRIESFLYKHKTCTMVTSNSDVSYRTHFCPPSIPWHPPARLVSTRVRDETTSTYPSSRVQTGTMFLAGQSAAIHVLHINQVYIEHWNGKYQIFLFRGALQWR